MSQHQSPIRVALLGATGLVGQRIVRMIARHPWFELAGVAASEKSVGHAYGEVVNWKLEGDIPPGAAALEVVPCDPSCLEGELVFSALDASVAGEVESCFALAGRVVVSNASSHRMKGDVPLIVPEINAAHLELVGLQRQRTGARGFIVTNPNCSTIGLVLALAPLHAAVGVTRVAVTTLQAASGAGYPGVPAMDLLDNVVPVIPGEEEKIQAEPRKIFGSLSGDGIEMSGLLVSAQTHRVPVVDGHLMSISLETARPLDAQSAIRLFENYRASEQVASLPSAPQLPIIVRREQDRPQPRLDREAGGGMAVTVGRIRECPVLGLRLEALSHNTVRGAAGGTLLVAELLVARGLLP